MLSLEISGGFCGSKSRREGRRRWRQGAKQSDKGNRWEKKAIKILKKAFAANTELIIGIILNVHVVRGEDREDMALSVQK